MKMTSPQPPVTPPRPRTRTSTNKATSAAELERVRNNQRRCRARRKEYISSLEAKIRELESADAESRTQKRLEELDEENKSLKRLLQSLGLREEFLTAYHRAARMAPNLSLPLQEGERCARTNQRSSGFPALESIQLPTTTTGSENHSTAEPFLDASVLEQEALDFSQTDASLPWDLLDFPSTSTSASESVEANILTEQLNHSPIDSFLTRASGSVDTTEHTSDTTTLCSWAFSLVLKSNRKGYSAADLDLKLRVGYRHGATPTEGCRVDNKVLLGVLADIM